MPYPPKITENQKIDILNYKKKGMSNVAIAKIFEVSEAAIRKILKRIEKNS
ncbi:MAG: helix-turn-helix domain-containing protein [Deltaproteobacteria bacterium]|nr:helix-turn-helix domain-containing protein [Deltaproteobacteria bacterium]